MHGIEIHRFGLAGREVLLFMLGASFVTLVFTRLYTRLARVHGWKSGRVGDVHLHHMVFGIALVLVIGMLDLAIQPGEFWRELFAVGFGVGAAFMLDEFALSLHLRDVYWTPEGRHSIDASIMWMLLGCLLLVGLAPFGIRDQTEIPRAIAFGLVAFSIILSVVTCLKGKLTLGLLSVFLPPVGLVSAVRLARPGSVWAQLFYRGDGEKIARSLARFHPHDSFGERLRVRVVDFVGGAPNPAPHDEHR